MEILLWLAPAAGVTLVAMAWVAWWGRERAGEGSQADREAAARRLGEALERAERRQAALPRPTASAAERSSGVAVRRSRTPPSVVPTVVTSEGASDVPPAVDDDLDEPTEDRRAS